jgi:hypothetical protein
MNSYRLNKDNKRTEKQVIEQIITNDGYDTSIIQRIKKPGKKKNNNNNNNKDSWAKFTYFGKETRAITKLFKETQLRIAFKVNNTVSKRLTPKPCNTNPQHQYERSLIWPDCHKKYVGQTVRSLHKRYKEHFHDFKYNVRKSSFATHLLGNNHSMGPINEKNLKDGCLPLSAPITSHSTTIRLLGILALKTTPSSLSRHNNDNTQRNQVTATEYF